MNRVVLEALAEKGVLTNLSLLALNDAKDSTGRLHKAYGDKHTTWTSNHTKFILDELLVTEALGGYHPHCNIHSQNRNLLYAVYKFAGTIEPIKEAIQEFGRIVGGYDFKKDYEASYQVQEMAEEDVRAFKGEVLEKLRGPGLAVVKPYGKEWVEKVFHSLENQTFTHRESGRSVVGFSPAEALSRSWAGSFFLDDQQAGFDVPEVHELAYDPFILDVVQELMEAPPILRSVDIVFNANSKSNFSGKDLGRTSRFHPGTRTGITFVP